MRFGVTPLDEAEGTVLAHTARHAGGVFKKGRVLQATDIAALRSAGHTAVFAARLEAEDVAEDEAAAAVAQAVAGQGTIAQFPFTGRANVHASVHGVMVADPDRLRAVNRLHEALTVATLAPFCVVEPRQMVATVKIIPFALRREILEQALSIIGAEPLVRVEVFRHRRAGLIITKLPQTKLSLVKKSEEAMRARVRALDGDIGTIVHCDHAVAAVSEAIGSLHRDGFNPILVFGASAIVDRGDVIPAAVTAAGGEVVHLGMPVDPGNLLMLGRKEGISVIGVPSCARSPKVNGFDWVLERIMAGIHVSAEDVMDMGAGGLLAEIHSRPSPREGRTSLQKAPSVCAVVLAAGLSSRMGSNKLLADVGGMPLIRQTIRRLAASAVERIVVVTGHDADRIRGALSGESVTFVHNVSYPDGLSSSLRRGIEAAADGSCDAALVVLGDMPLVSAATVGRLIAAFSPAEHRTVAVPVYGGQRGNPVLWGKTHFDALRHLAGDQGARGLIDALPDEVVEVAVTDEGILRDADTPEALAALRSAAAP